MSKLPNYCNCLFLFAGRLRRGRGGLKLTLLDKFITKNRQLPSCIVKFLQILSSSCIHLIMVSL